MSQPQSTARSLASASAVAILTLALSACGPAIPKEQQLARLRAAANGPVEDRMQNQQNSRVVEEVLASDALMGMHRSEVSSAIGKGDICQYHDLCAEQGFEDDDWYYDIGQGDEAQVGKRPALIVGFNGFGTVERVYQLRVH